MGTWGPGNFDNDGAADSLGAIAAQLERTIDECFADEDRSWLDEDGEAMLMPSVDLLTLLCEHRPVLPPPAGVIGGWRERYLAIFDEQIDGLDPEAEFKVARCRMIEETFVTLLMVARQRHEGIQG